MYFSSPIYFSAVLFMIYCLFQLYLIFQMVREGLPEDKVHENYKKFLMGRKRDEDHKRYLRRRP